MPNPFVTPYKLGKNALDFVAKQIKTIYDGFAGTDEGDGAGHYFPSDEEVIDFLTVGSVCTQINGVNCFCFIDGNVHYSTSSGFHNDIVVDRNITLADDNSDTLKSYYENGLQHDGSILVSATSFHVRETAVPETRQADFTHTYITDPSGQGFYSCKASWGGARTGTFGSYRFLKDYETLVNPVPASQSSNFIGSGWFSQVQQYILSSPILINTDIPTDAVDIQQTTYNNNDYTYVYSKDVLYLNSSGDTSYNDIQYIFNNNVIPYIQTDFPDVIAPNLSFPSYREVPEGYIEPFHELNYSLQMPDTSDYLDVSVISSPLSICAQSLDYFWNAITSLGFAPVLGFCLVATLIIKGLRGD